jgi:hypothetical protein
MTEKTESQCKLPDFSVLNELMHKSETVGGIIFGSALYGGMWEKSDYDIMLVCRNCSGHTALHLPGDRIWHINIVKLENWLEYMKTPSRRTLHALLVNGLLFSDPEGILQKEKDRLADYPEENRLIQIAERLSGFFAALWKLNKALALQISPALSVSEISAACIKLAEISWIDEGCYFNRSPFDKNEPGILPTYQNHWLNQENNAAIINELYEKAEPFYQKWAGKFYERIFSQKPCLGSEEAEKTAGISCGALLDEGEKRGELQRKLYTSEVHGFPTEELGYCLKRDHT